MFLEQTSQTDQDIRIFLRSRFSDICSSREHRLEMASVSQPWPADSVIDELVEEASGQFIYASTVLKFVDDPFKQPTKQLDLILSAARASKIADLGCFGRCHRIDDIGSKDVKRRIEELLDLQPEKALRTIRSLVDVSKNGEVKFFHKSLPDFLLDASRSGDYFIDINAMHSRMALACLKTIRLNPDIAVPSWYGSHAGTVKGNAIVATALVKQQYIIEQRASFLGPENEIQQAETTENLVTRRRRERKGYAETTRPRKKRARRAHVEVGLGEGAGAGGCVGAKVVEGTTVKATAAPLAIRPN
ncbi:hypothetical protein BDZ97DRAFT_2071573 [Flammula alnicola]|nr:hypothetical protein BDZ97DRAFT_2071573 [Flammula alnicola]